MIHFLGLSEDSSSSILNQLQLSDGLFRVTCEDIITVVKSTEDKHEDKLFQILLRHQSYNTINIFFKRYADFWNCLAVEIQVHDYKISGFVCELQVESEL